MWAIACHNLRLGTDEPSYRGWHVAERFAAEVAGVTGELELALGLDHESEGGCVLPAVVGRSAEVGRRCLLRSSLSAERTCSADGGVVAPRW